jgi:hypothetical protein
VCDALLFMATRPQQFPFAVVSFNLTGIALQAVREGKLYSVMRARSSVLEVLHELYMSLFYAFYIAWKKNRFTIMNFGPLKKYTHTHASAFGPPSGDGG